MKTGVVFAFAAATFALSSGGALATHNFHNHDEAFDFFLEQQGQLPANRVYRSGPPAYDEDYYYWIPRGQDRAYPSNGPQSYGRDAGDPPAHRPDRWWPW